MAVIDRTAVVCKRWQDAILACCLRARITFLSPLPCGAAVRLGGLEGVVLEVNRGALRRPGSIQPN
jgi:hypothetical protein